MNKLLFYFIIILYYTFILKSKEYLIDKNKKIFLIFTIIRYIINIIINFKYN